MNWNDYEALWKRQELPVGANADIEALKATFETKRRKLAKVLFAGDALEAGAGVAGVVAYGFIWWQIGKTGWPIALAMALVLGVVWVFVRELAEARRARQGADASLLAKVEADIAALRRRRRLILGLWKWYLGPTAASVVIVGMTITRSRPQFDIARDPVFLGGFSLFFAGLLWLAWEGNRRAVRKQLEPRIEELEKLRREISADGEQQSQAADSAVTSIGMTKFKIFLVTVPTALLAVFLLFWHAADKDAGLRQLTAEDARLREENAKLAKTVEAMRQAAGLSGAVSRSATGAAPLAPAAAGTVSRQTVPLAGGLTPIEALGNAGRATARNAFATQLWAARTGDVALEASAITFGAEARARLEALAATLPADMRSEYDTPEKLMAFMLAGSPHPVGGMQVTGEVDVDANDVTLQTEWQHVDDDVVHQSDVSLVQDADGWKMVVPYSLVNRASNYLSRTIASPPAANPGK